LVEGTGCVWREQGVRARREVERWRGPMGLGVVLREPATR